MEKMDEASSLGCMDTMFPNRDLIYKDHDDTQVLLLGHYKYSGKK